LIFHSIAGALNDDGISMMQEAVQDGGSDGAVIVKNGGPLFKGFVRGQNDGTAFVTLADDLEEQVGAMLIDG